MLPAKNGVSTIMCPHMIVTRNPGEDYEVECRIEFGAYTQVHDENDLSNATTARTNESIAMNPTGNEQGAFNFLSLLTGKRLSR